MGVVDYDGILLVKLCRGKSYISSQGPDIDIHLSITNLSPTPFQPQPHPIDPSCWEQRDQTHQPVAETHSTTPDRRITAGGIAASIAAIGHVSYARQNTVDGKGQPQQRQQQRQQHQRKNGRKEGREKARVRKAVSKDVIRCVCGK